VINKAPSNLDGSTEEPTVSFQVLDDGREECTTFATSKLSMDSWQNCPQNYLFTSKVTKVLRF
jgi:hypothetical protein